MWVIVSELAFQLFALVALGFVLRRFGVIDDNFQKRMGNLLILVVLPAASGPVPATVAARFERFELNGSAVADGAG